MMKLNSKSDQVKIWQNYLIAQGFSVMADGDFGAKTDAATRSFQREHGLREDGIVGANTLKIAGIKFDMPLDNTKIETCLPESGLGFVGYNREAKGADQYGTEFTIDAMQKIAAKWNASYPDALIQFGDISRRGGGRFPPHASHRTGRDFDMRPFRKDLKRLPVTYQDANYDRVMTEEFVRFVRADYPSATIYFNDPKLIGKRLTAHCGGHDNHLHIRLV